jgi:hypothetical protein
MGDTLIAFSVFLGAFYCMKFLESLGERYICDVAMKLLQRQKNEGRGRGNEEWD